MVVGSIFTITKASSYMSPDCNVDIGRREAIHCVIVIMSCDDLAVPASLVPNTLLTPLLRDQRIPQETADLRPEPIPHPIPTKTRAGP